MKFICDICGDEHYEKRRRECKYCSRSVCEYCINVDVCHECEDEEEDD